MYESKANITSIPDGQRRWKLLPIAGATNLIASDKFQKLREAGSFEVVDTWQYVAGDVAVRTATVYKTPEGDHWLSWDYSAKEQRDWWAVKVERAV
jgi:hypothetical protein